MIESVSAIPEDLDLVEPYAISTGLQKKAEYVLVIVKNEEGQMGVGEASPMPGYSQENQLSVLKAVNESLGPAIAGLDERRIPSIIESMDIAVSGDLMAKSAVEVAIHDLVSRCRGISIIQELGGPVRNRIGVAGSIGFLSLKEAEAKSSGLVADGISTLKVKIGREIDTDLQLVRAIRTAVGKETRLRLDANQGYNPSKAISNLERLEAFEPELFEQPVSKDDIASMARIAKAIDTPIVADEPIETSKDILRFAESEAADMVKLKVNKCGGLSRTLMMSKLAREFGMSSIIGSGHESSVGVAAECAAAMSCNNFHPVGEMNGNQRLAKEFVKRPLIPSRGVIAAWSTNGLGLELALPTSRD